MPPKKGNKESKKTENKKKEKIVQDKTFGLKNKKGAKQQKFVKQIETQVKQSGDPRARKLEQQRLDEKKKKEAEKKRQAEIDALFKETITQPKLGKGVDPKSVLCQYFKQGKCTKGDKCKYSHDLAIERKSEKRSVYADGEDMENDTIDNWDDQKLKDVVEKKHGAHNKKKNKTAIVCKFFIKALERKKYGWFWSCPNGDACIYRHALPPGFVLKCDQKKMEDQVEKITIEELIEKERAALGPNVTKVTLQTFLAWKKRKREEKIKEMNKKKNKRKNDFKSGKGGVSGREVFEFQPDMVGGDDEEAGDDVDYSQRSEDGNTGTSEVKGVSSEMFVPLEIDEKLHETQRHLPGNKQPQTSTTNGEQPPTEGNGETSKAEEPSTEATKPAPVVEEEVPVDESLFTDDLDAELEGLEL